MLWLNAEGRNLIMDNNDGAKLSIIQMSKLAGNLWANLPGDKKSYYLAKSNQDKEKYIESISKYRKDFKDIIKKRKYKKAKYEKPYNDNIYSSEENNQSHKEEEEHNNNDKLDKS